MYVIFTYSYNQFKPNVGKYTISMEHLGYILPLPGTVIEKYMAQSLHIGSYGPSTNLPFSICAIYIDLKVLTPKLWY